MTWESINTSAISSGTSRVLVDGGIPKIEMKLNNNFGAMVDTIGLSCENYQGIADPPYYNIDGQGLRTQIRFDKDIQDNTSIGQITFITPGRYDTVPISPQRGGISTLPYIDDKGANARMMIEAGDPHNDTGGNVNIYRDLKVSGDIVAFYSSDKRLKKYNEYKRCIIYNS